MVGKRIAGTQSFDDTLKAAKTQTGRYSKIAVERLVLRFLKTSKIYKGVFQDVALWRDSPYTNTTKSPINMVGQGHDWTKTAILCHFGNLSLGKVTKFLSAAQAEKFDDTLVIHADGKISARAHKMLKDASATILSHKQLDEFEIDWGSGTPFRPKMLRKYQSESVGVVAMGLARSKKGKVVMPPGTGKTLVSLKVAERLAGLGKTVLVAAPTFGDMLQTIREWSDNSDTFMHIIIACSEESVGKGESITDSYVPVTSDFKRLASKCSRKPGDAMVVVFATHDVLADIVAASGVRFDLAIYDDAHLLTDIKGHTTHGKDAPNKSIYMTATPQIPDSYHIRTGRNALLLDDKTYGNELYRLDFDDAVKEKVVADFKIRIVMITESTARSVGGLRMPIKERSVGVAAWRALQYSGQKRPAIQKMLALTKSSRRAAEWDKQFGPLGERITGSTPGSIKTRHTPKGDAESEDIQWLEGVVGPSAYRILFAQKASDCEIPGVLFLDPFSSVVEATRYVGNTIRKHNHAKKEYGYLIVPVSLSANETLARLSDQTLRKVWVVLAAALAHHPGLRRDLAAAELDGAPKFQINANGSLDISIGDRITVEVMAKPRELKRADPAKMARNITERFVTNSGSVGHYKAYLEKVVETTKVLERRMTSRVANSPYLSSKIEPLVCALKSQINGSITQKEVVRIMVQHMVFARLLGVIYDTKFVEHDPVARVIQSVVSDTGLAQDMWTHQDVYQNMDDDLRYINTCERRRNLIKQAYNAYRAFGKTKPVYDTPTEVVDFIIRSVQHILSEEFNVDIGDRSTKILNPFAGSGGFVTRLLEIISADSLYGKYGNEVYASDMALPAYYTTTACAGITHQMTSGIQRYVSFEGAVYTDAFGSVGTANHLLKDAAQRAMIQHVDNVRVILGDPPASISHPDIVADHLELEARIAKTYVASARRTGHSGSTINKKNPYIKAQRWATDRLRGAGVIGFVVPATYLIKDSKAGIRASMSDEFTDIWCLDMCQRGVFANKNSTIQDIGIVIMVRNPKKSTHTIHYTEMGKRYAGKDKTAVLKKLGSISGIKVWRKVNINSRHRWAPR